MDRKKARFVCLIIPSIIMLFLIAYDLHFLFWVEDGRDNGFEYIKDVRIMNTYLGYLLVVLSLLLGFFGKDLMRKNLNTNPLIIFFSPLIIAIIASCLSLIFFPVPYKEHIFIGQLRWLFSLICQQTAIIFTCVGLLAIIFIYREEQQMEAETNKE